MTKRVVLSITGLVGAAAAFAIADGIGEYQTARSARTYVVVNGVERDLTPEELVLHFLIGDTIRAIPFGALAAAMLSIPLFLAARALRSVPATAAYALGCIAGGLAGGALSFAVWVIFGGWGPPSLLPALAAGVVLAPALVGAWRTRKPAESPSGLGIH
jgi:hypothetical protein